MAETLIQLDCTSEGLERLLSDHHISPEERKKIARIKDIVDELEPRKKEIEELREEQAGAIEDLASGKLHGTQKRIQKEFIRNCKRRIIDIEETNEVESSRVRKGLTLVKRLERIRTDSPYRTPKKVGDAWNVWLLEELPRTSGQKTSLLAGLFGGISITLANIVPSIILNPAGFIFLVISIPLGMLFIGLGISGFQLANPRCPVYKGRIPIENITLYQSATEKGIFDSFIIVTSREKYFEKRTTRVLCGVIFNPPATRVQAQVTVESLPGNIFEITRWISKN